MTGVNRVLAGLKPEIVWNIFEDITRIPRPSKREEKIRQWVKQWAEAQGIGYKEDKIGNIILYKPAVPGREHLPTLVLQGHLDMVCQKVPESPVNFDSDPIPVIVEGGSVTADGTTLGADNGIGVAMAMATLIAGLEHGPLEVLLTVDEETGLTGAFQLEPGFFTGKLLLNIDGEDIGKLIASSAGGGDTKIDLPLAFEEPATSESGFKLSVDGLVGGHSGVDIHLPRLNAIKALVAGLKKLSAVKGFRVSSIEGGNLRNVIPRNSVGSFAVVEGKTSELTAVFEKWKEELLDAWLKHEPGLKITLVKASVTEVISGTLTSRVIDLLSELPHGYVAFSKDFPDLVETSNNLAIVRTIGEQLEIFVSSRSAIDDELAKQRQTIKTTGERHGGIVTLMDSYPGWAPDINSPFLNYIKEEYEKLLGKGVMLRGVHGGLECGLFMRLDPGLQIVSIGPDIKDAHSPNERITIESVIKLWEVLKAIVENLEDLS
ncbi:MAG: beta-Ala-His dipeptidase [Candidatus Odinarchaeota archaeon]